MNPHDHKRQTLRGTPTSYRAPSTGGMQVQGNVFAQIRGDALTQTLEGLVAATPNLVGATPAAATVSLVSAGLTLGAVTPAVNAAAAGTIISTAPAAGATAPLGTPVNIVVSAGPPPPPPGVRVPNLVGGDERTAANLLRAAGLVMGDKTRNNYSDVVAGIIAAQSPPAGAMVPFGSSVGIAVSLGPEGGGGNHCFAGVVC